MLITHLLLVGEVWDGKSFGFEDNLLEIMCPESFGGVRFDIILCMSCFNHVPSGDTLCQDAISSLLI